jgi:hypothetical protein
MRTSTTVPSSKLVSDRRGAALVEFACAIGPICMIFFCTLQLGQALIAHIVFRHAAFTAARMAVVGKSPMQPGSFVGNDDDPLKAALEGMDYYTAVPDPMFDQMDVKATYPDADQYGPVSVTLTGTFHCSIPLGSRVICKGRKIQMTTTVTLPHQGARYAQEQ